MLRALGDDWACNHAGPVLSLCLAGVIGTTIGGESPFGCHISEVKRQVGGACGYSVGNDRMALKKPPSLHPQQV